MRPRRSKAINTRQRWILASRFAICAALTSLFIYWLHLPLFERLDVRGRDLVFQLRTSSPPPADVVIVAVDEKSVKQYGRWPWPRSVQAKLISKLKSSDPAVIALDIVYCQPQDPVQDKLLTRALAQEGPPVIGGYFFRDQQTIKAAAQTLASVRQSKISMLLEKPRARHDKIPTYPFIEGNHPTIAPHFSGFGFFNSIPDADGLVRSAPLVLRYQEEYFPSLALQSLATFFRENMGLDISEEGISNIRLGDRMLPVDMTGKLALNFYNGEHRIKTISAADIMDNNLPADSIRGKLVFVGVTELGIADVRPTPVDHNFPGVGLHATVAANVIQGFHLYHDSRTVLIEVLLMAFLPLAMLWLMTLLDRPFYLATIFFCTAGLVWLLFYKAVTNFGLLISFFYPTLSVVLSFSIFELYKVLVTQRQTRYMRRAFSSYVSPALVSKLIDNPDALCLKGETRNITVLFADIRNFTTLSEEMTPEELVQLLNRFLGPMTELLMREKGTLDKYIGDAIMAIYNAPLDIPDHAERAAVTAIKMHRLLHELNKQFKQDFNLNLRIGVGLHTGAAVVGNMGSARRFNYTAMGDTVNISSRLEGRTKYYGVEIIVSQSTRELLGKKFILRKLDRIRVKGKKQPVAIFQLFVGDKDSDTTNLISRFEEGLAQYLAGNFPMALDIFEALHTEYADDQPTRIYVDRCRYNIANPPNDWDGIFTMTDK